MQLFSDKQFIWPLKFRISFPLPPLHFAKFLFSYDNIFLALSMLSNAKTDCNVSKIGTKDLLIPKLKWWGWEKKIVQLVLKGNKGLRAAAILFLEIAENLLTLWYSGITCSPPGSENMFCMWMKDFIRDAHQDKQGRLHSPPVVGEWVVGWLKVGSFSKFMSPLEKMRPFPS